jgi:hypothetical protein
MALKFKKLSSGSGSATVTTKARWNGTAVPTSGYVDKIYINPNVTIDELRENLKKLE